MPAPASPPARATRSTAARDDWRSQPGTSIRSTPASWPAAITSSRSASNASDWTCACESIRRTGAGSHRGVARVLVQRELVAFRVVEHGIPALALDLCLRFDDLATKLGDLGQKRIDRVDLDVQPQLVRGRHVALPDRAASTANLAEAEQEIVGVLRHLAELPAEQALVELPGARRIVCRQLQVTHLSMCHFQHLLC